MAEGDFEHEFRRERLKDLEGKRRARERKEAFSLVERGAILLLIVAWLVYALIHHPDVPPIPAWGCGLGGILALLYGRGRS